MQTFGKSVVHFEKAPGPFRAPDNVISGEQRRTCSLSLGCDLDSNGALTRSLHGPYDLSCRVTHGLQGGASLSLAHLVVYSRAHLHAVSPGRMQP